MRPSQNDPVVTAHAIDQLAGRFGVRRRDAVKYLVGAFHGSTPYGRRSRTISRRMRIYTDPITLQVVVLVVGESYRTPSCGQAIFTVLTKELADQSVLVRDSYKGTRSRIRDHRRGPERSRLHREELDEIDARLSRGGNT